MIVAEVADIPDFPVTDFLTGRYARLRPTLTGVRVSELLRFTDTVDSFLRLFPEQDRFVATLFHEQELNPMLKSYAEAQTLRFSCLDIAVSIRDKRGELANLISNNKNATTAALTAHINEIAVLETKQKNLHDHFYGKCSNLYPLNSIVNNWINHNITAINSNYIQHLN